MRKEILAAFILATGIGLAGCTSTTNDVTDAINNAIDDDDEIETSAIFPTGLAVTSPLEEADGLGFSKPHNAPSLDSTAYAWATGRINALLGGETPVIDLFAPAMFLRTDIDASCFGPTLIYEDHPDAGSMPDSGELPSGDLGIWTETDDSTGEACSAAELNARLQGVSSRSVMALMGLASMISTANDAGVALPAAGASEDLTDEMNAIGIADTTFSNATIAQSSGGEWTYELDLTYTASDGPHVISVDLAHEPGASQYEYEGLLSYKVNDDFSGGNCSGSDVTHNGSLHYIRSSETDLTFQNRSGMFCGSGTDGLTETVPGGNLTGNVVNPAESWGNNFSIFTAEFDPESSAGSYSYAWQAGRNDDNSRVFLVGLNEENIDGEAYYGYGDDIAVTDGSITGFYCSWAAPGSTHTLLDYAQRQNITYNPSTGQYEPTNDDASDITYAPTNSCEYDGSGTFKYDRNLDDDLADETAATVNVASGETLEFDLMDTDYGGTTYATITEVISARGLNLPVYP